MKWFKKKTLTELKDENKKLDLKLRRVKLKEQIAKKRNKLNKSVIDPMELARGPKPDKRFKNYTML